MRPARDVRTITTTWAAALPQAVYLIRMLLEFLAIDVPWHLKHALGGVQPEAIADWPCYELPFVAS